MHERRLNARKKTSMHCWCASDLLTVYAKVSDLSAGGFFVRTELALPLGLRMSVRFAVEPPVEALARIVWRSDDAPTVFTSGVGFEFESISDTGLHQLGKKVVSSSE